MLFPTILISALLALSTDAVNHKVKHRSSGCGKELKGTERQTRDPYQYIDSQSGATPRKYLINFPEGYKNDVAVPLIFSYHGRTKSAIDQRLLSRFSNSTYGFDGIVVYPEGVKGSAGVTQWQGDIDSHGIDDVKFTMELLDAVSDNYCIDQTRVYASGKSNGGGLTGGVLACDPVATTRIAAFAPVSAAIYLVNNTENGKQVLPPCNPTQTRDKIPMLEFHGWLDTTIPYDGGINNRGNANSTDIIKWVHSWVKRDGFKNSANQTTSLCTDEPNKLVTRYSWQDDLVVHYNMSNFKHAWPSTTGNADGSNTTCKEADATTVILKWFTKWSLSEG